MAKLERNFHGSVFQFLELLGGVPVFLADKWRGGFGELDSDVVGFIAGKWAEGTFEMLVEGKGIGSLEFLASDFYRFNSRGNKATDVVPFVVVGVQVPIVVDVGDASGFGIVS